MKKMLYTRMLLCIGLGLFVFSCTTDEDEELMGNWIRRSDFEGITRSSSVSFTIGEFAYVGLGYDGDDDLVDFWRYDASQDFWTRVDTFPGVGRRGAIAFSIDGKGYVGTGYNGEADQELKDFWSFDPNASPGTQWQQVADFAGSARYNAVGFALSGLGYIGTGYDGNWLKDFYEYDPNTNTWQQVVSLGGSKREDAVAFVIDDQAYVGTGRNNGVYEFDFWAFSANTKTWTRKLELDEDDDYNIIRHNASAFSLGGLGYIIGGSNGSTLNAVWEYDPLLDSWEQLTGIEGSAREGHVAFSINSRAYITTGRTSSIRLDDLWEFQPNEEYDEDD